eukprot:scaffold1951_cov258-Pinguiococcus_pyrenoidosus.AAC.22
MGASSISREQSQRSMKVRGTPYLGLTDPSAYAFRTELGGKVKYYGKPNASIFEVAMRELDVPKSRIAHVGDSLHHDVQGAANAGVDSIFISSGIHGATLGVDLSSRDEHLSTEALNALFQSEEVVPDHVALHFRWSG